MQKLTELGIDRIVPFRAARSVVRWDDARAAKAAARLRLVARAAAMQSHRPWLPEVAEVADLADLRAATGVAMADRSGHRPRLDRPTSLVGPEGGWAPRRSCALGLPPGRAGRPRAAGGDRRDHCRCASSPRLRAGLIVPFVAERNHGGWLGPCSRPRIARTLDRERCSAWADRVRISSGRSAPAWGVPGRDRADD